MSAEPIQALLHGLFGLPPPTGAPPAPAPPERFPIFTRPADRPASQTSNQKALLMTLDTNSTIEELGSAMPGLPPGAPTLAKVLHRLLGEVLATKAYTTWDDASISAVNDALEAIAALPTVPDAREVVGDKVFWREEDGRLTPEALVKPAKLLEDMFVRTVAGGALAINASLIRFKAMSFSEAQALIDTVARDYGVTMGGKAGNSSFFTHDRSFQVQIQAQERITVGATIEVAKAALNEYLAEAQASDEVKAIITSAFGIDDQGRVRVAELVRLRRLNITHPKWLAAMRAIDDAMETAGKAIYLRVKRRLPDGKYELVSLDLASA